MWKTRFTQQFPCQIPIMGAPMAGVSGGSLAAETCRAGALGFIAAGHLLSLEDLDREVTLFRKQSNGPLALGFIGHSSLKEGRPDRVEAVLKKYQPQVVQFFAPGIVEFEGDRTNVDLAHDYKCQVMVQVGSVSEAEQALKAGVDCLIAQGTEAGGHGLRPECGNGTLALACRLVSLARQSPKNPIILAAGGIVDGRGLAAALALGCDGVVLGTRLWASQEALGRESYKRLLASPENGPDQVLRTTVMDQIANTYSPVPWPSPYDSSGVLRNETTDKWHGRESDLKQVLMDQPSNVIPDYKDAVQKGENSVAPVYAGQGVGEITSIDSAYDIICRINKDAIGIIHNLPRLIEGA